MKKLPKDKSPIAIATGDWHIHPFTNGGTPSQRLTISLDAAAVIVRKAKSLGVPILFTGDFFHTPKSISTEVHSIIHSWLNHYVTQAQVNFIAIDGNHDLSQKNTLANESPSHLRAFQPKAFFHRLSNQWFKILKPNGGTKLQVWGIPYYDYESDWFKAIRASTKESKTEKADYRILLLHGNAPGAKVPHGFEVESNLDLDYLSKRWDLVLMGHIHKPQLLRPNICMVGSPIHQTSGDAGTEMGYWIIYEDLTMELIPLNAQFPEFRKVESGTPGDTPNPKQDYLLFPPTVTGDTPDAGTEDFNPSHSSKKLARSYCRAMGITEKPKLKALIQILEDHD